ncbi:MAG: hypothetical protein KatS3mg097_350 [Candidatus Parcubacteria bacterium]|nr:MAG: hypothetical protein KatS3mg097_350 [Candidatus Parcubacteria bacterium]
MFFERRKKRKLWQIISLFLFIFIIVILYNIYLERSKNMLYYKEINNFKKNLTSAQLENLTLMNRVNYLKHPLNIEKERKDKMGEKLPNEKVIVVSKELLDNTVIPIFGKEYK